MFLYIFPPHPPLTALLVHHIPVTHAVHSLVSATLCNPPIPSCIPSMAGLCCCLLHVPPPSPPAPSSARPARYCLVPRVLVRFDVRGDCLFWRVKTPVQTSTHRRLQIYMRKSCSFPPPPTHECTCACAWPPRLAHSHHNHHPHPVRGGD